MYYRARVGDRQTDCPRRSSQLRYASLCEASGAFAVGSGCLRDVVRHFPWDIGKK